MWGVFPASAVLAGKIVIPKDLGADGGQFPFFTGFIFLFFYFFGLPRILPQQ